MKEMNNYLDEYGCIVQKDSNRFNAIDSAFLTNNYYYQMKDKEGLQLALNYVNKDGRFMRYHTDRDSADSIEPLYWTESSTVSRDNSIGTYIALASIGAYDKCRKFALDCIKRGNFYQNTHTVKLERKIVPDFVGISGWSILLRGLYSNSWYLYPLLLFTDLFLLLNFLTFVLKNKYFDPDYNSTLFHMVSTAEFCVEKDPTFVSKYCKHLLYTKTAPHKDYFSLNGVGSQIREYSRSSYDPPVYLASELLVEAYKKETA